MIKYSINVCVTSLLTRNTKAFVLNKLIFLITVTSEFKLFTIFHQRKNYKKGQ